MSLQLGRVTLDDPSEWEQSGNLVRFTVPDSGTVAEFKVKRQQLLGMVGNPWERVVPVTWSLDSTQDGFYRVVDVSVPADEMTLTNGFARFGASLERVEGYSAGWAESICHGSARSGKPGGVTASTWHAVPGAFRGNYDTGGVTTTGATRGGPGGNVRFYTHASYYYDARTLQFLEPADWYDMAATIKVDGSAVVGRQIVSDPTDWELTNGLLTIGPGSSTSFLEITGPTTLGAAGTPIAIDIGGYAGGTWFPTSIGGTVTVTRNCPEEVGIRIAVPTAGDSMLVDINLRRGSLFATVVVSSTSSGQYGIGASSVTAMSALASGGGQQRSSNDADGNRLVLLSAKTYTPDLVNGRLYLASTGTFHDMAVGIAVGGSGASAPDRATDLRDQYFAAITETQNVISR